MLKFFVVISASFFVHKIIPLLFPLGEFVGLSSVGMVSWLFSAYGAMFFLILFSSCLIFSGYFLLKIRCFYGVVWAIFTSTYITMFVFPGHYGGCFFIFGEWSDIVVLMFMAVVPMALSYAMYKFESMGGGQLSG